MKRLTGPASLLFPNALRLVWLLILSLILLGPVSTGHAAIPVAQGNIIIVNSYLDAKQGNDGLCTLREAIIAANSDKKSGGRQGECSAGNGADTIMLDVGRYELSRNDNGGEDAATTGDLDITSDITLIGHGFGQTIIDSSGIADRALHILNGTVEISNITVTKNGGTVSGPGGGLHNRGNLTLIDSTIEDNSTNTLGGGIYNTGILTLKSSTISGNTTSDSGAGLANASSGSMTLDNSTISGNLATNSGGGLYNAGITILNNATIAFNTANNGSGIANASGSGAVNFRNTIIAKNGANDCTGTLSSLGYNLDSDGSCVTNGVNNDLTVAEPLLDDALQNNGGQTDTHALLPGSPAIDAGDPNGCFSSTGLFAFDQRGEARPADGDSNGLFGCDIGAYEVGRSALPLGLLRAFPDSLDNGDPTVHGLLDGFSNVLIADLNLKLFANAVTCDPANPGDELTFTIPANNDPNNARTDENGYFIVDELRGASNNVPISGLQFITAQATNSNGTLLQSNCVPFSTDNDVWPTAFLLELEAESGDPTTLSATIPSARYPEPHYIDQLGQSRWYKFKIEPSSNLLITLGGINGPNDLLPADYDMTLYGDIEAAFQAALEEIQNPEPEDLVRLGAQFAGSNYSGSNYSGSNYSGSNYSGSNYSGSNYSGSNYSGSNYSGSNYSGSNYSGSNYSGDAYSGSNYSGSNYSGDAYSGSNYSGSNYSGAFFGGSNYSEAHADAQERSLIAVAATGGTVPEDIFVRTWSNDEFYYLRVRGRNGAFSLEDPFRLEVRLERGGCSLIDFDNLALPPTSLGATSDPKGDGDGFETIILTDESRFNLDEVVDPNNGTTLRDRLTALSNHHMVDGVVVDVNQDDRVTAANALADDHLDCPFAKNLVAESIKNVVDVYRAAGHPVQFVVIVGIDKVIPFFRHPDIANLANESQFVPPVDDGTAAQAALRLDYFLSDDDYVAKDRIEIANTNFPIMEPGLAVGRLVETPAEMSAVIDAFLNDTVDIDGDGIPDGVVRPQTSLVTGYDFLEDATLEIEDQLREGLGVEPNDLITPIDVNVINPDPDQVDDIWTADDLESALLESGRHDLVFLAGHFSANSALAADYQTELLAETVANSDINLLNTVIFSIGCHSGYNVADDDGIRDPFGNIIPQAPRQPDWAQAFAGKGATLIAGSGYQYGETETKEYSERLYIEFSKKLRTPGEPIAIGHALNSAKLAYVTQVPQMIGIHVKSLLEAGVYGLPMLRVDMPNRLVADPDDSILTIDDLSSFHNAPNPSPGKALDLRFYDLNFTSPLHLNTRSLIDIDDTNDPRRQIPAEFLTGTDDLVVTNASEPFLPGELFNVDVPGWVLRGVGFRGGTYTDINDILPLTGAPTTEAVALHSSWQTAFFHPMQTWNVMYLAELIDGKTRVMFTPAQHKADLNHQTPIRKSVRRQFNDMNFRLFYSNNLQKFDEGQPDEHIPALSAPPSIVRTSAIPGSDEVVFRIVTAGDPAAGIQEVWVTWTDTGPGCPCTWQALDLVQRPEDSRVWEATLPLNGLNPDDIRFIPWAVNGFGRIGYAMNFGQFFVPGPDRVPNQETRLTLVSVPPSGENSKAVEVSADLTYLDSSGIEQPLANQFVEFRLGPGLSAEGITNAQGRATVTLNLFSRPGDYRFVASFPGTDTYLASSALTSFKIEPRAVELIFLTSDVIRFPNQDSGITVRLREVGNDLEPVREQGIFLVVTDQDGKFVFGTVGITNLRGDVSLGTIELAPGQYLPAGEYRVTAYFNDPANNPLTSLANDDYTATNSTTTLTVVESPCRTAVAVLHDPSDPGGNPQSIWQPNGVFWTVDVHVDDPNDGVTIMINDVFQDEPVGNIGPDAKFITGDTDSALLRAERDGNGDGRVYHLFYTINDGQGFTCQGETLVPVVEHDQSGEFTGDPSDFDDGALFDSTIAPKFIPEAIDDQVNTDEDSPISGNLLDNDLAGKPNDTLTITAVNGDSNLVGTQITLASGTLLAVQADGSFAYNPNNQFESLAASALVIDTFTYQISDDDGDTDVAMVTVTITGINDNPLAADDLAATSQDSAVKINVIANDSDVEGDNLVIDTVTQGGNGGSTVIEADNTVTFIPAAGFLGDDTFTYTISDGNNGFATATVTVTVNAVNNAPVANNDGPVSTNEDAPITIDVASNDTDVDGNLAPSTAVIVSNPLLGTVANNGDGSFTYTPNVDINGADSFSYMVADTNGLVSNEATVTIVINPMPDPPVANDDASSLNISESTAAVINVILNDTDPDGDLDPTNLTVIIAPTNGTAVSNGDGTVTYTPNVGFIGQDTFVYQVCDVALACDTATVTVTVDGNRPPDAVDDPDVTTGQGDPVIIEVLVNDIDEDGDQLTVIQFSQGTRGTVTANADGTLTYSPNSNFKGTDSFTYTIADGRGGMDTATVTITTKK